MEVNMSREEALNYLVENYHNNEIYIGPIEDYIFNDAHGHYDLFAHEERSFGPFYGYIRNGEFYLADHNLKSVESSGMDPKVEGAMYRHVIQRINELIDGIPPGEIPEKIRDSIE